MQRGNQGDKRWGKEGKEGKEGKGDGRSNTANGCRALQQQDGEMAVLPIIDRGQHRLHHGHNTSDIPSGVYEKDAGKLGHRFYAHLAERLGLPTGEEASEKEGRGGEPEGVVIAGDVIVPSSCSPVSLLSPSAYWLFRSEFEPTRDFLKEVSGGRNDAERLRC